MSKRKVSQLSELEREMITDSAIGTIVLTDEERVRITAALLQRKNELLALQKERDDLLEELGPVEEKITRLCEVVLPALMEALNETSIPLGEGSSLKLYDKLFCGITNANREEAFNWLEENGHESVISETFQIKFDRGMEEEAEIAEKVLTDNKIDFFRKADINANTLKALLKKCIGEGEDVPFDTFSIYVTKRCEIKNK